MHECERARTGAVPRRQRVRAKSEGPKQRDAEKDDAQHAAAGCSSTEWVVTAVRQGERLTCITDGVIFIYNGRSYLYL